MKNLHESHLPHFRDYFGNFKKRMFKSIGSFFSRMIGGHRSTESNSQSSAEEMST